MKETLKKPEIDLSANGTVKRPEIDLSECVLCDICTDLCPYIFIKNDAGYIEVAEADEYPEEDIDDIIKSCRGDCIGWNEDA